MLALWRQLYLRLHQHISQLLCKLSKLKLPKTLSLKRSLLNFGANSFHRGTKVCKQTPVMGIHSKHQSRTLCSSTNQRLQLLIMYYRICKFDNLIINPLGANTSPMIVTWFQTWNSVQIQIKLALIVIKVTSCWCPNQGKLATVVVTLKAVVEGDAVDELLIPLPIYCHNDEGLTISEKHSDKCVLAFLKLPWPFLPPEWWERYIATSVN